MEVLGGMGILKPHGKGRLLFKVNQWAANAPKPVKMANRILILFAHPALEKSRVQKAMLRHARQVPGVTITDLYQQYPDLDIDVAREQEQLLRHDLIIFQHPFYWYSSPAIIKQWMDLVLEHGWAYGSKGNQLAGKYLLNAISAGGSEAAYHPEGRNRFTIKQFLAPFDQTARLCQMHYLAPFAVHGTHRMLPAQIEEVATIYSALLAALVQGSIPLSTLAHPENLLNYPFPIPV